MAYNESIYGPRPSVIRIQMEAVGLFLEVRMKNDAVIKGEFCVLTCVLTFGLQALSRLCTSFLYDTLYPQQTLGFEGILLNNSSKF